jgi:glycerol uptake facilitator protein
MLTSIFIPELVGTAFLILLGTGVVANVRLVKTNGFGGGFLLVNFGWGLAVYVGVYAAYKSGGYLNPAVVFAKLFSGAGEYATGVKVTLASTIVYIFAELFGAIIGAVLAWLAYKKHYDETDDSASILATFSTSPGIRSYAHNFLTEAIATFALCYFVLISGGTQTEVGPLAVALVIVGIGASLGGPTGYAINPTRDLGPRIAHFFLPIPKKGSSDWAYSWVPIVGPLVGAIVAGLLVKLVGIPHTDVIDPLEKLLGR